MGGALRYIAVINIHEALTTDSSNVQMWRTIWQLDTGDVASYSRNKLVL